ncbi:FeoB-associated Cys-rich membrane protein [Lacrimispora sp. JR3]|uniref:FeoB-associated Cys-rich membrane protein n=1 Tax=Lacrimispora sinapis TaxID=3111456 RepID=UPI00374A0CB3
MGLWLWVNGPTIIITLILMVLVILAGRKITKRKEGCGCGHCCSGCEDCWFKSFSEQTEKEE